MPVRTRSQKNLTQWSNRGRENNYSRSMLNFFACVRNIWESYLEGDCQMRPSQITRLGDHKYSALDSSFLNELCMQKFWQSVVQYYPLWLAPNLITFVGLIINLITVLILSHFCFSATETAPWWAYFQAALGLFIYQTLDATDGKQARRTNSSSPLGELFDHGCDSCSQVLVTLNICYAMQLGTDRYMVLLVSVVAVLLFYCAHWATYCTGQMRFSKFDVTEAQMIVIGVLLITALFGPGLWSIALFGVKLKALVLCVCGVFVLLQFGGYLKIVLSEGVGKNGSTVAGTSVLFPLFPLLAICLPFVMVYSKSTSGVYDQHITLFCMCFGAVAAKATNRLIIAHMSRSELELWDWIYLSPLVMMFNQYYDFHFDEYKLLMYSTIYAYISLFVFCIFICRQFCEYLNIHCFKLRPADAPSQTPSTSSAHTRQLSQSSKEHLVKSK